MQQPLRLQHHFQPGPRQLTHAQRPLIDAADQRHRRRRQLRLPPAQIPLVEELPVLQIVQQHRRGVRHLVAPADIFVCLHDLARIHVHPFFDPVVVALDRERIERPSLLLQHPSLELQIIRQLAAQVFQRLVSVQTQSADEPDIQPIAAIWILFIHYPNLASNRLPPEPRQLAHPQRPPAHTADKRNHLVSFSVGIDIR